VKKILIAGGLGYLGGRMAKYFLDNGYSVRITTRIPKNDFPENIPANTSVMQLDYCSEEQLNEAMKGIDTLIHLAGPDAHTNSNDPESLIRQHIQLTGRLLRSAKVNSVKKFIYFSTIHVYGKNMKGTVTEETNPIPVHPFAKAHLEAEGAVASQSKHIAAIIIRCANSFGAPFFKNEKCWELVVNDLCKSAFQNGRLIINSSGQSYRNFIAADDVARAIHHLLELNNKRGFHDIYNMGSSNTVRITDIAKKIQKELKDSFDYDCPIETKISSTENNKENSFIFSINKLLQTGFR
ncbi:uncharacterized protein METZ01_LOCUS355603, partial [marine metagenome]